MTKNKPIVLLNEAFPSYLEGEGIFSEMSGVPWSQTVSAALLDLDYFANHSGEKKCSPLVYKLMEDDYTLSTLSRQKIAALVVARFLPNWTALWNSYHAQYNPLNDYSITESGSHTDGTSLTRSGSNSGTNTGTDNLNTVHGESIVRNARDVTDVSNNKYGFNSSEAVPTDTGNSTQNTNAGETHSGTDQNNRTLNLANSLTTSESSREDKGGSYSKTRTGMTGNHTIQEIIRQERELWIEDFFTRVYSDVDSVIASLIYNREHEMHPYYLIGFGYYQI